MMNWFTKKHEIKLSLPTWWWLIIAFLFFLSAYGQIRTAIDHWDDDKKEIISKALETEEGRKALAEMLVEQPGR